MLVTRESTPLPSWLTTVTRSQGMESASGEGTLATALPSDAAAVIRFPRRSGEMFAEGFAVFVEELGVGSFQRPRKFRGAFLADVDLIALRMNLKKKLFVGRRLELGRNLLRGSGEG